MNLDKLYEDNPTRTNKIEFVDSIDEFDDVCEDNLNEESLDDVYDRIKKKSEEVKRLIDQT